jgi:hypothetical protein
VSALVLALLMATVVLVVAGGPVGIVLVLAIGAAMAASRIVRWLVLAMVVLVILAVGAMIASVAALV